jgi:hypothetical protein
VSMPNSWRADTFKSGKGATPAAFSLASNIHPPFRRRARATRRPHGRAIPIQTSLAALSVL